MNELTVFNYGKTPIRTIQKDEQIWWVLADVCKVLELSNSRDVASRLDDDEKNTVVFSDGIPGNPNKTVVNEAGLYNLIFRSNKPEAKQFKRWVTHEVLPAIRKTGNYGNEKMEIAKLIASCKSATAVKGILSLYGVSTNTHQFTPTCKSSAESVTEYLKTVEAWELTDMPCKDVYEDYVSFCKGFRYSPLKLSIFSREIRLCAGLTVRRHRVDGKLVGFYV